MDEKELIQRAQSGDFEAFNALIEANKAKIYALAHKLAGSREDAEDIVQETFLKAIDNIDRFRGESSFGTWLYTIALNQARAQYAKAKQFDLKPVEDYLPAAHEHNHGQGHDQFKLFDWDDPHRILETSQLREIIDKEIAKLPYKYREAFVLRYVEELPVKEVARITRESEAATKSRILRARLALRDALSHIFEERYGRQVQ
jgi:RNA polymerase sigma-70 factor (ECF subfamily)